MCDGKVPSYIKFNALKSQRPITTFHNPQCVAGVIGTTQGSATRPCRAQNAEPNMTLSWVYDNSSEDNSSKEFIDTTSHRHDNW
jgi:hypothetical protein